MTFRSDILELFEGGTPSRPVFLPDLTLWYDWHQTRGTLPREWRGLTLPDVARAMGFPIWLPIAPWRQVSEGVEVLSKEESGERIISWNTSVGTLASRWTLSADGDWWQVEYPVKTAADLAGVLEIAEARTYGLQPEKLTHWEQVVGDDGIVALEIPRRPYSDLLHQFLGWSEGLMFLREPLVSEIIAVLESKLQDLVSSIVDLPSRIVLSPDNLDGQFVSPKAFDAHMAESYRASSDLLHRNGKRLVVHIGGPIRRLLAPLVEAEVDGLQGIAGPPQSDATMKEARNLVGPETVLWGGLSQDYLLSTYEQDQFESLVGQAASEIQGAPRTILGVSDRVPVNAVVERLGYIREMIT
jgi:hypothetical protein